MPPSLAERLLDAVWDTVSAAVDVGLSGKRENALADVVPLSDRPYGAPGISLPPWAPKPGAPSSSRERIVAEATRPSRPPASP